MNWKAVAIIIAIMIAIAVGAGIYMKQTQTTESQKGGIINNFNNEPHYGFFGCNRYVVPDDLTINARPPMNRTK